MKNRYVIWCKEVNSWVIYDPTGTAYFDEEIEIATEFESLQDVNKALESCKLKREAFVVMQIQ